MLPFDLAAPDVAAPITWIELAGDFLVLATAYVVMLIALRRNAAL